MDICFSAFLNDHACNVSIRVEHFCTVLSFSCSDNLSRTSAMTENITDCLGMSGDDKF